MDERFVKNSQHLVTSEVCIPGPKHLAELSIHYATSAIFLLSFVISNVRANVFREACTRWRLWAW